MDYEKLKEHEKSFLAEVYIQKERKIAELKDKMKELSDSYSVSYKSTKLRGFEKNYRKDRNKVELQKSEIKECVDKGRKYGDIILKNEIEEKKAIITKSIER